MLVYDGKVPINLWRVVIVTMLLPSRDSEIGGIIRIAKTNAILKRPVNKLFPVENTYHSTNQRDKARGQKLVNEAARISKQKRKYEC